MAVAEAIDYEFEAEPAHRCATPRCRGLAGFGRWGLFCPPCADFLADIARQLQDRTDRKYRIFGTEDRLDD
jgi:hypothetical protein